MDDVNVAFGYFKGMEAVQYNGPPPCAMQIRITSTLLVVTLKAWGRYSIMSPPLLRHADTDDLLLVILRAWRRYNIMGPPRGSRRNAAAACQTSADGSPRSNRRNARVAALAEWLSGQRPVASNVVPCGRVQAVHYNRPPGRT